MVTAVVKNSPLVAEGAGAEPEPDPEATGTLDGFCLLTVRVLK